MTLSWVRVAGYLHGPGAVSFCFLIVSSLMPSLSLFDLHLVLLLYLVFLSYFLLFSCFCSLYH